MIYKYEPFWQEVSVKFVILRLPLRPVGLLFKQYAHGPHRSREKQSLAINKIEQRYDSSTLLKKIKESLFEFWRMYTPGLCIVKLKLVLWF